jgi:hypothetical protein
VRAMPFLDFVSRSISASHVTKNYAVGLEMSCPGGACHWAPEIPSTARIAGVTPGKCELAHTGALSFQNGEGSGSCPQPSINRSAHRAADGHNWPAMLMERPSMGIAYAYRQTAALARWLCDFHHGNIGDGRAGRGTAASENQRLSAGRSSAARARKARHDTRRAVEASKGTDRRTRPPGACRARRTREAPVDRPVGSRLLMDRAHSRRQHRFADAAVWRSDRPGWRSTSAVMKHRACQPDDAIRQRAVVVIHIPEVKNCESDQQCYKNSHLCPTPHPLVRRPLRRR